MEQNENNITLEEISISEISAVLKTEENVMGPLFSIWRFPYIQGGPNFQYATACLEKEGKDKWSFNIEVKWLKENGLGSFLMKKISEWAYLNHIKYIYGFLSGKDYENKNWQISLPFYKNLPAKENKIKNCYFVALKEQIFNNFKKYDISILELESKGAGFVVFEIG